ncbi:OB-fold nucleic acid binding domain-containing protein, partial [Oceanospirillum sp. HFRX-1_2]
MATEQQQDTPLDSAAAAAEENKLIAERRAKLAERREKGNAFPNTFRRDALASELQAELGDKDKEELEQLNRKASVAGRIMRMRGPFIVIQDMSSQIQLYVDKKNLPEEVRADIKSWDFGDIVGASGPVHKSGKGDLYVYIETCELLTKSLRPLPDKFHGLTDQEMRYRQRYVDLIMNQESRKAFEIRAKVVSGIRNYLSQRGYMEAET